MKRLATIKIIRLIEKEQRKLTFLHTPYLYAEIEIDFLAEYHSKDNVVYYEPIKMNEVELSRTNYSLADNGALFIIDTTKLLKQSIFTVFAKKLTNPKMQSFSEDRFLLDYREEISRLEFQYSGEPPEDTNLIESNTQEQAFLATLKTDHGFIKKLNCYLTSRKLYYDIYDVNGFFSVITDDNDFYFYVDMGDTSYNTLPIAKKPFCVFISHFHFDHYNMLISTQVNANNYILPYSGSVLYNGTQLYPSNEIRLLMNNPKKTHLIFLSAVQKKVEIGCKERH